LELNYDVAQELGFFKLNLIAYATGQFTLRMLTQEAIQFNLTRSRETFLNAFLGFEITIKIRVEINQNLLACD